MPSVIGIRFKAVGKIYYFDPDNLDIKKDDKVIVETTRGLEFGHVVVGIKEVKEEDLVQPLKKVLRLATKEDLEQMEANKEKEKEAFQICLEKINEHQLPMKLIEVECTFDNSKIIFFFTAEGE